MRSFMSSYNYTLFYYRLSYALRIASKSIIFSLQGGLFASETPYIPVCNTCNTLYCITFILYLSVYKRCSKCYNVLYKLQCSVLHIVLCIHLGGKYGRKQGTKTKII